MPDKWFRRNLGYSSSRVPNPYHEGCITTVNNTSGLTSVQASGILTSST